MSLNYAPLEGFNGDLLSNNYDYVEMADEVENAISTYPLITVILKKLRERYFFKRESVHEIISKDFLDFKNHNDEIGDYLINCADVVDIDTVGKIEELYDEKVSLTPDYVNMAKNKDTLVFKIMKQIEEDTGINFDETTVSINKLREYQKNLATQYLEIRQSLRDKLEEINKKARALNAVNEALNFDLEDKEIVTDIVDKYINRKDFVNLIHTFVPIKMKLYVMLGLNRFSGFREIARGECRICFESTSELYAITDCGHTFCKRCIDATRRCALCRAPIQNKMRIYL